MSKHLEIKGLIISIALCSLPFVILHQDIEAQDNNHTEVEENLEIDLPLTEKKVSIYYSYVGIAGIQPNLERLEQTTTEEEENITTEEETTLSEEEIMTKEFENIVAVDQVDWFKQYKTILANHGKNLKIYDGTFTNDEIYLMMQVVRAEIGDYQFNQICDVAEVIFNRVYNDKFPNTLYEVLVAPEQFTTISSGVYLTYQMNELTVLACEYVYEFYNTFPHIALFFDSRGQQSGTYNFIYYDNAHYFYGL